MGGTFLLSRHDLDIADRWFAKYGEINRFCQSSAACDSHVHRVSGRRRAHESDRDSSSTRLPDRCRGVLGLAYVGQKLGEQWDKDDTLKTWFHRFDFVIGIVGVLAVVWWIWRHIKHSRLEPAK